MRIKITENGPYLVTGSIPISEKIITKEGHHYVLKEGRTLPQQEEYALCRCGHSKHAPFCDGSHISCDFYGEEVADKSPYIKRVQDVVQGDTINLLDDGRCAFARFCHRESGDVWTLTSKDTEGNNRSEAITASHDCPAGRLTMYDDNGNSLDQENKPEIIIVQDPEQGVSAGIFVKGPIIIESVDKTTYEVRNREALCRCGKSSNKPFCDASHVSSQYQDQHE